MIQIPFILSLKYRDEIERFCKHLPKIGLDYFVMYIVFNDGSRFVLSNIFHMLESYYAESLYKEDYCFRLETITGIDHFLCDKTAAVSDRFKLMIQERYGLHRAYYIVRECPECTFIFGAIKEQGFDQCELIYNDTLNEFEDFCVNFVSEFIELILQYSGQYANSFILTNDQYRKAVIKGGYPKEEELSEREKDCLIHFGQGNTTKEVAKILGISKHTVETHSKNIKDKMNCTTMIEAALEGVNRGYIGAINRWPMKDMPKIGSFKIIKTMNDARREIEKTNLALLNSVGSE